MTEPPSSATPGRPEPVEPYVRGAAWSATAEASYPRADRADCLRLPIDAWGAAQLSVGVRLADVIGAEVARVLHRGGAND